MEDSSHNPTSEPSSVFLQEQEPNQSPNHSPGGILPETERLTAERDETLSTQSASLLRVLSQDKNISQNVEYTPPVYFDYFLKEGDNLVGRGEDCDVTLSNGSLSQKHAQILVEKGSHFIKDLGSRNKTFRRKVALKPNIYYELTDGVQVTLANITCYYLIGNGQEEAANDEREVSEESETSTVLYGSSETQESVEDYDYNYEEESPQPQPPIATTLSVCRTPTSNRKASASATETSQVPAAKKRRK
ncbi:uncharacterized protein LOC135343983 isoform X3 [Halichondria panicea]|uniref:uncharacterized protein LOC135343983 isoform X3 n=1 Tax=Halichondria panicea TaxID=6063 RepID=UPI00312B649D